MKQLVAKLTAQVADAKARQRLSLAAAEADGVTAEDKAKHVAEFDRVEAEKASAQANLERAQKMVREEDEAAQVAARTPEREPVAAATKVHVPDNLTPTARGKPAAPAECRRHGTLRAFKGAEAEENAYMTGLWVAATMYGHKPSMAKLREHPNYFPEATLSTINNNSGGYFVPPVMDTAILKLQELYGVVRRRADIVPMSSETWKGPRWTNNMTAYWVSQANAPTQSEPGWDMIELVAKDLAAFGKMSVQLNEDALINLGDEWAQAAAVAFSYAEDNAAFNGDGSSSYGGITGLLTKIIDSANAASLVTATGHATLGALTVADYSNVVGKLPLYPGIDPCWFMHKEVWAASIVPIQLTAGGGVDIYQMQEGAKPRFLGYDIEFTQVMPKAASVTTGVTGILFGDLRYSTKLGDRRQRKLRVGEINDDMIKQLMTLFTASRVDIINHTITDPKDSTHAGPVVGLKLG